MKTLTRRLPAKYRSAVRFVCVGAFGTALQYGIYYLFLSLFERFYPDMSVSEEWSGIVAIVLAGIINYFVLVPFYSKKKSEKKG